MYTVQLPFAQARAPQDVHPTTAVGAHVMLSHHLFFGVLIFFRYKPSHREKENILGVLQELQIQKNIAHVKTN